MGQQFLKGEHVDLSGAGQPRGEIVPQPCSRRKSGGNWPALRMRRVKSIGKPDRIPPVRGEGKINVDSGR